MSGEKPQAKLADVLLFAYAFPPDRITGAARPGRFCKYLRRMGHDVQVIGARPESGVLHDGYVHRVEGDFDQDARSPGWYFEKCIRKFVLPHDEGTRWAWRASRAGASVFDGRRPVMLSTSPPLTVHLAAAHLKRKYGWKWIADFRDPLVGNAYRTEAAAHRADPYIEKFILSRADLVIANTDAVAEAWKRRYPQWAVKFSCIWNGFDPEGDEATVGEAEAQPVMRHLGSIYGDRYPQPLLQAIAALIAQGEWTEDTLRVELVGPMPNLPAGVKLPEAKWFRAVPSVPKQEADRLAASAHYLLLLDVTETKQSLQVPAKLFDYIRVGRPILTVTLPDSPVERVLKQSGVPTVILYPRDSPAEIQAKLRQLLTLRPERVPYSAWFAENFDGERQTRTLSRMIQSLA